MRTAGGGTTFPQDRYGATAIAKTAAKTTAKTTESLLTGVHPEGYECATLPSPRP